MIEHQKEAMSASQERVLVLSVDRDGDLERKARIQSPVAGREAVMSAATSLAVADPEEADANALFAAVKEYDKLRSAGVACEVAAVCGLEESGFQADRKIRKEVESLLSRQRYSGIVLISDGAEDELVVPILQTLKPIVSVRRVVVKHSRSVEENYMVLGRYLRMLVFDSRYSKWAIGVPGIILLFAGILVLLDAAYLATLSILIILGAAFLVRGFNIDRTVAGMLSQKPYGYIRLFTIPTSILILIVGLSSGYSNMTDQVAALAQTTGTNLIAVVSASPSHFFQYGGTLIGFYLQGSLLLIWSAFGVYLAGTLLIQLVHGSRRAWRSVTGIVVLALLFFPMDQFSAYLIAGGTNSSALLLVYVFVGLAMVFVVVGTLYPRLRGRPPLPTTAAPGPSLPQSDRTQQRDEDQDSEARQD
jgi:putative membrane protein